MWGVTGAAAKCVQCQAEKPPGAFLTRVRIPGAAKDFSPRLSHLSVHTPSTAFRHLPPNSARFSYATEGALFISAQLSSDVVSALRKVRVLI